MADMTTPEARVELREEMEYLARRTSVEYAPTVLALLDALEAAEVRVLGLEAERDGLRAFAQYMRGVAIAGRQAGRPEEWESRCNSALSAPAPACATCGGRRRVPDVVAPEHAWIPCPDCAEPVEARDAE